MVDGTTTATGKEEEREGGATTAREIGKVGRTTIARGEEEEREGGQQRLGK